MSNKLFCLPKLISDMEICCDLTGVYGDCGGACVDEE